MAVTGAKKTYIAALVGGNHFVYHVVERDEELISLIIKMEKRFWEENVLQNIEPMADGSQATTDTYLIESCLINGAEKLKSISLEKAKVY